MGSKLFYMPFNDETSAAHVRPHRCSSQLLLDPFDNYTSIPPSIAHGLYFEDHSYLRSVFISQPCRDCIPQKGVFFYKDGFPTTVCIMGVQNEDELVDWMAQRTQNAGHELESALPSMRVLNEIVEGQCFEVRARSAQRE